MGIRKHLYCVFKYWCKIEYAIDKFICAPASNYNEMMHFLEFASVAEQS
jgi:hypothetical protein